MNDIKGRYCLRFLLQERALRKIRRALLYVKKTDRTPKSMCMDTRPAPASGALLLMCIRGDVVKYNKIPLCDVAAKLSKDL